ncbi:hypothetical protein SRABI118_04593 [Massilia sp. Bi118]|uniref:hypothetical protein n=1 Tax=Massilia sp. Bi118 TaxID=2822346 RepID=UPI001DB306FF|nr:hypothetical protein [Massilia sp. Bi118]CAH0306316.1 hypothetical protein SRABI118_04593 [Massilia sp. Bi118]
MTRISSKLVSMCAAGACLLAMNAAHAQLSALGGLASSLGGMLGKAVNPMAGADAYDVDANHIDTFVRKSAELSEIAGRSVTAINAAFASEEQLMAKRAALAAIAAVTDPKDRAARYRALYDLEASETKRLIDSGGMEKRMAALDGEKKKLIGQALLNFAIGALQAVELGRQGKSIAASSAMNPVELVRLTPVKDAIPMLAKVAIDVSGFMGTVVKLAKSADIAVPKVGVDSKAVALNV